MSYAALWVFSSQGVPLIDNVNAVLHCQAHSVHTVGDHYVWYGQVEDCQAEAKCRQPLVYFAR